ncbi:MAG: HEAT repeat domain-containing protein [Pseudomonadota bacterium]
MGPLKLVLISGVTGIAGGVAAALVINQLSPASSADVQALERRLADLESASTRVVTNVPPLPPVRMTSDPSSTPASSTPGRSNTTFVDARDRVRLLTDDNTSDEVRLEQARELLASNVGPMSLLAVRTMAELNDPDALAAVQNLVDNAEGNRRQTRVAQQAVGLLAEMTGVGVDVALYEYLGHADVGVQLAAARSLEQRGDISPMAMIVDDYTSDLQSDDLKVRVQAVQSLGRTQSATAVAPLVTASNDDNAEVRLRAVQSLGRTRETSAIEPLTQALEDPVAEVRSAAARALDQVRNPETQNTFRRRGPPR